MIYELLRNGKQNAVSTEQLMLLTGVNDVRTLRNAVANERKKGALILSSNSGGYYLPGNLEEVKEYITTEDKKIRSLMAALEPARKCLRNIQITGQISMDIEGEAKA